MIGDARELPEDANIECDICIVGGGPAGIILALELAGKGLKVVLLEGGDIYFTEESQALYEGPNLGFPYDTLETARLRFLGGSSNHWSGYCIPFSAIDFEARGWMPHSGWPITLDDLEEFYQRAYPYFEIQSDRPFDFDHWAPRLDGDPIAFDQELLVNGITATSPPTAFGFTYEDHLREADGVQVYLNANVTHLETNDIASEVTSAAVACIDGPNFSVNAQRYVLCTGGIEVPRLLFNSNRVKPAGLGNDNDLVGRFFNEHIGLRQTMQTLVPGGLDPLRLYTGPHFLDVGGVQAIVASSEALLRREEIGGFYINLFPRGGSPGFRALRRLGGALRRGTVPPYFSGEVYNLFTDLDGVTDGLYRNISDADESLFGREWLGPWLTIECVPNPDSRVVPVQETDRFGKRKVGLDWHMVEKDVETAARATEILSHELGRLGIGRTWSHMTRDDFRIPETVGKGKHHNGTVRMSDSPKTGVVDADLRVHGVSNLHVSSCGVFPTSGYNNPTLTIGAMSIRLADHLSGLATDGKL